MKTTLLLFFIIFPFLSYSQKTEVTADHEISMSGASGRYVDGQWTYFKNGEKEPFTGVLYAQFPDGNCESRQEFENGIGEGTWINYWPNGNLKEAGTYQQNKVAGPIKKYYPSGKLKSEGTYRDWRIRIGRWNYYDESGKMIETIDHGKQGDFRDVEEYYKTGEISKSWYRQIKSD